MMSAKHAKERAVVAVVVPILAMLACGSVEPSNRKREDASMYTMTDGGGDANTHVGTVCRANTDCPMGKRVCADGGICVGCTADSDCATATSPICDTTTKTCVPCTTDAQCVAKLGMTGNPGVCMFHTDGHCATDVETVYVQEQSIPSNCPATSAATAGSASLPFCTITQALAAAGTRLLLVLRGENIPGDSITNTPPVSIIGQSAVMEPATGVAGLHISGATVYVRSVKITTADAATIGIVVDSAASIQLDGVDVENMPQGGLRVTASTYDVVNSIFAENGGTQDEVGRFIGGAYLSPPSGASVRFAFNTVVSNQQAGVVCASSSQAIDASLLAKNLGGGSVPDYSGCTLAGTSKALGSGDPMLTRTFRATANSPCFDFVKTPPTGASNHDIDSVMRPQGAAFDCGASEYKAP